MGVWHRQTTIQSRRPFLGVLGLLAVLLPAAFAEDAVPPHRAKQIRDAAPEKPRAAPRKPRRLLVFVTPTHLMEKDPHKGYNIPFAACAMKALGEKTGAFEAVVSDDLAALRPDALARLDAIALCNTSGPWITPSDAAMERLKDLGDTAAAVEAALRKGLLDFVANGGGLFAIHFAIGGNAHWPEFRDLLGASYDGHPWNEEVGVRPDEPDHPLVAAFGGKGFRLAEEVFQFKEPYARSKVRVLLSLDTAATNMGVKWINRKDGDFALAWAKAHGKGRVFYTAIGHRTEVFWNPRVLSFYLDGLQFAAGDVEADVSPAGR
jgi:type 1 glutamine amidotransferase